MRLSLMIEIFFNIIIIMRSLLTHYYYCYKCVCAPTAAAAAKEKWYCSQEFIYMDSEYDHYFFSQIIGQMKP